MIIEPISCYKNELATPYYYRGLRQIAKEEGIQFIVDESKTGFGITGKMWCHDYWYLSEPADFVTFNSQLGLTGHYSLKSPDAITFHDSSLLHTGKMWKFVQEKELLEKVQDNSTFLKIELNRVAKSKGIIYNVRGLGNFLAFDVEERVAENLQEYLIRAGINLVRCGPNTFGIRPALTIRPLQSAALRETLLYYSPNYKHSMAAL